MPVTLTLPKLSPTMEEGMIVLWHKKEGDFVNEGDLLFEIATDKATVEYQAIDSGFLRKIIVPQGVTCHVNEPIALLTEKKDEPIEEVQNLQEEGALKETKKNSKEQKESKEEPKQEQKVSSEINSEKEEVRIKATPLARNFAKEEGIDLSTIQGTGPSGRIVLKDLKNEESKANQATTFKKEAPEMAGSFSEESLTPMRKVIAKRLEDAKATIPHFYITQQIDVESLVAFKAQLEKAGLKVSFNDCVIRATALALKKHSEVNSGFNPDNRKIIRFKTVDIAVAVSLKEGLITPIIRQADCKSLEEISHEMRSLAKLAKENNLKLEQYSGGSFSISNMGMYGISSFQAIINPPQAAILAVGAIVDAPIVKNGVLSSGKVMNLSLSLDHRVVDGAEGSLFLKSLQHYLEFPVSLLI